MSVKLDPKEVLKYLNELGYYNITGEQLKDFIRDLKTLIKYDQKKASKENQENIKPPQSQRQDKPNKENTNRHDYVKTGLKQTNRHDKQKQPCDLPLDVFNNLHSSSTFSSRARSVPKEQNIISVEILKPKSKLLSSCTASLPTTITQTSINNDNYDMRSSITDFSSRQVDKKPSKPKSAGAILKGNALKPKTSFIRPRIPVKSCKSDPVALYQQYQAGWKNQKVPGQNNHYDLRWAIREKMLGPPNLRPRSTDRLSKKSDWV